MASHEVEIRVMKTVSEGTKEIIRRRVKKRILKICCRRSRRLLWFTETSAR